MDATEKLQNYSSTLIYASEIILSFILAILGIYKFGLKMPLHTKLGLGAVAFLSLSSFLIAIDLNRKVTEGKANDPSKEGFYVWVPLITLSLAILIIFLLIVYTLSYEL